VLAGEVEGAGRVGRAWGGGERRPRVFELLQPNGRRFRSLALLAFLGLIPRAPIVGRRRGPAGGAEKCHRNERSKASIHRSSPLPHKKAKSVPRSSSRDFTDLIGRTEKRALRRKAGQRVKRLVAAAWAA